ncbi:MAG: hypothetical protein FNP40_14065 [Dehalobacter sp. 4CP]|nr:hypothetical protein [Dehalobacter sp. 4CP]
MQILFHVDQFLFSFENVFLALAIVCLMIFCETGLVVTPFLPGDSMLFVTGTLVAARMPETLWFVCLVIAAAALLGNISNYTIGHFAGKKILASRYTLIKPEHLQKTEDFYAKYGSKTLVIARFIPIVRTIAPFMAGMGSMTYRTFLIYNLIGGVSWVLLFVVGGFFLGNVDIVKNNLSVVMILIIIVSISPGIWAFVQSKLKSAPNPDPE